MPEYPPEIIEAAAKTLAMAYFGIGPDEADRDVARAVLGNIAAELGDHAAAKILAHMEAHGLQVTGRRGSVDRHLQEQRKHAYRMHFGTAARVAAHAFLTEDDTKRLAAEALARGDYVACTALEDRE